MLSPQRNRDVLAIARAAGAFVIEDDFARRLVHADAPPLPPPLPAADDDGVVVHIRSLTKPASPGLRVAALVARMRAMQAVDSFFVPRPLQEAALELVAAPSWNRHLRELAAALRLPDGSDPEGITAAALRAGVAITPGGPYFTAEPPAPYVRLSYAQTDSPERLADAVARLRGAFPSGGPLPPPLPGR